MKLTHFILTGLMSLGLAFSASAGTVADMDSDGVPDPFDGCIDIPDGAGQPLINQVDPDNDGYNVACDGDYTNEGLVNSSDFSPFLLAITTYNANVDHDGNGMINSTDFSTFVIQAGQGVPGPSGLACAGTIPCDP